MQFNTLGGKSSEYERAYRQMMYWFGKVAVLSLIPGIWKMKFLFKDLFDAISKIQKMTLEIMNNKLIERSVHPEKIPKGDLLDGMLNHLSDLSMEEILSNVWLFFFAGHETTASLISWAMFYFAKYPEFQTLAREEVDRVLGTNAPDYENVKELTFLDLFIKEVLRMSGPAQMTPFPRYPNKDIIIDGKVVPAKTLVNVAMDVIHHLEEFWPEPSKFDPYRFTPENSVGRHPYAYLPFLHGRRHCLGSNFATLEIKIFLASFLQKFIVEYGEEPKIMHIIVGDVPSCLKVGLKHRNL